MARAMASTSAAVSTHCRGRGRAGNLLLREYRDTYCEQLIRHGEAEYAVGALERLVGWRPTRELGGSSPLSPTIHHRYYAGLVFQIVVAHDSLIQRYPA